MFDVKPETVEQLQIKLDKCNKHKAILDKMIKDLIEMGYEDNKEFNIVGKRLIKEKERLYRFAGGLQNAIAAGGTNGALECWKFL